ncbi:sarcosine oxidase subunit delta [Rhizobium sp. 28DA2]|uniref:sarcosine oxidase subunit delta n=1 Tax=Rhizobium sp. 28DA2 TaxID=3035209 RepID=UPI002B24302D|nr:sarcosine oxidase subunit delta [Rhizobium sp. 28DA2]
MLIPHPLLGPRDAQEFTYLGDAALLRRPDGMAESAAKDFNDYVYLRDNPAGCIGNCGFTNRVIADWLVVTRNTVTHEILGAELANEVALRQKADEA